MQASLTGIYVATRGLYASQVGLSVTTDNASNANTTGYSRQTVTQTAVTPAASYGGSSLLGNGVEVTSVDQERDALLDQRYWTENTREGEWETKANTLTEIEEVMNNSTSSTGFSTIFDEFYSSLETLNDDPSDSATRSQVQEYGQAICDYLNDASSRLTEIKNDLNTSVKTTVTQINSYATQIAELNQRISVVASTDGNANTLKDARNVLVDKLTALTGCSVTLNDDSSMTIQIGSATLVDGERCNQLKVSEDSTNADMYKITWDNTGEEATITGGTLKGQLDLRDGDGTNSTYKGVDYYIDQLNTFAQTFAKSFNEGVLAGDTSTSGASYSGHADGYTATGTTGVRFFSYTDSSSTYADSSGIVNLNSAMTAAENGGTVDEVTASADVYKNITAANLCLSSEVASSVNNIAASSAADETENSTIIDGLIDMLQDTAMFNKGTPGDYYNSIISTMATDSATAQRREENYTSIVKQLSDRRTSVSGVDTNEETAYMTQYQNAYDVSAKMVSTWSELYSTTINMVNSSS